MTYQAYKKTLTLIGFLYFPMILWDVFGRYLAPGTVTSFFAIVAFFSFRIPSLLLLFVGIYASMSGVKGTRKFEAPVIFIVLGAVLVIASFGPPILFGYLATDTIKEKREYIQSKEKQTSGEMSKEQNSLMESRRQLEIAATNTRNTAMILVCMLVITTVGFLVFLWYRFRKGALRSGFK